MRITTDQLLAAGQLLDLVAGFFPKRAKLRRLGELVRDAATLQGPYKDARTKIDLAADAGEGTLLTAEEVQALDAVMDAAGKVARKVKRS